MLQFEILPFSQVFWLRFPMYAGGAWPEALLILFWAHMFTRFQSGTSQSFCIAAGPWIAVEITEWWNQMVAGKSKSSVLTILNTIAVICGAIACRFSPWIAVPVLVLIFLNEPVKWPQDFPKEKFPVELAAKNP